MLSEVEKYEDEVYELGWSEGADSMNRKACSLVRACVTECEKGGELRLARVRKLLTDLEALNDA